jgi:hypothetical protein
VKHLKAATEDTENTERNKSKEMKTKGDSVVPFVKKFFVFAFFCVFRVFRGGFCFSLLLIPVFCSGFAQADLAPHFEVVAAGGGGSFDRHYMGARRGRRMDSMLLVAPVTIRAPLAGSARNLTLECVAAPVFNVGDGMRMDVLLMTESGERLVYTRYFDAGRRAEDRDWIPLSIPLDGPATSASDLIIRLSAGPHGDLVADWLALASVRLTQRTQSP